MEQGGNSESNMSGIQQMPFTNGIESKQMVQEQGTTESNYNADNYSVINHAGNSGSSNDNDVWKDNSHSSNNTDEANNISMSNNGDSSADDTGLASYGSTIPFHSD